MLATLFRVEGVRERLANAASDWLPGIESANDDGVDGDVREVMLSLEEGHRAADIDDCLVVVDRYLSLTDMLAAVESDGAVALERLRSFRTKRLAHALFDKEPDAYPRHSDLTLLLEIAKEAAALSSLAVEGLNTDFAEQTKL